MTPRRRNPLTRKQLTAAQAQFFDCLMASGGRVRVIAPPHGDEDAVVIPGLSTVMFRRQMFVRVRRFFIKSPRQKHESMVAMDYHMPPKVFRAFLEAGFGLRAGSTDPLPEIHTA